MELRGTPEHEDDQGSTHEHVAQAVSLQGAVESETHERGQGTVRGGDDHTCGDDGSERADELSEHATALQSAVDVVASRVRCEDGQQTPPVTTGCVRLLGMSTRPELRGSIGCVVGRQSGVCDVRLQGGLQVQVPEADLTSVTKAKGNCSGDTTSRMSAGTACSAGASSSPSTGATTSTPSLPETESTRDPREPWDLWRSSCRELAELAFRCSTADDTVFQPATTETVQDVIGRPKALTQPLTASMLNRYRASYAQYVVLDKQRIEGVSKAHAARAAAVDPVVNPFCTNPDEPVIGASNSRAVPAGIMATVGYDTDGSQPMPTSVPCHCTTARLTLSLTSPGAEAQHIMAVVDSGAAWTALSMRAYHRLLGTAQAEPLQQDARKFHAVSGTALNVRGYTGLVLHFGKHTITTLAYVFEHMAVDMLLGTNTLTDGRMVLDYGDRELYSRRIPDEAIPICTSASPMALHLTPQKDRLLFSENGVLLGLAGCKPIRRKRSGHQPVTGLTDRDTDSEVEEHGVSSTSAMEPRGSLAERVAWAQEHYRAPAAVRDKSVRTVLRTHWVSEARTIMEHTVKAGATDEVVVWIADPYKGRNISLAVDADPVVTQALPQLTIPTTVQQSRSRAMLVRISNPGEEDLVLPSEFPLARVTAFSDPDVDSFELDHAATATQPADASTGLTAMAPEYARSALVALSDYHTSQAKEDAVLPSNVRMATPEELDRADPTSISFEGMPSAAALARGDISEPTDVARPYFEGGKEDLDARGLDLSESFNTDIEHPRPLTEEEKAVIAAPFLEEYDVLATNAKAPKPCKLKFAWVDIPTHDAKPIRQKPYSIPHAYVQHVRDEIAGLLKAGLIEPGYSDWCSPVIVIVKKDSDKATGQLKVKTAIDFRKLNASCTVDSGGLGTQGDTLYGGRDLPNRTLADAAGGYYQFRLTPEASRKTCFILPTAAGGTTFCWKVAPYGLARMPAHYSRVMMYVLSGLRDFDLGDVQHAHPEFDVAGLPAHADCGPVPSDAASPAEHVRYGAAVGAAKARRTSLGRGEACSWLDDICIRTGYAGSGLGIHGHAQMLRLVLRRLAAAGITLKGSKTHVLRLRTEVLGHIMDRDGLHADPKKVEAIDKMPEQLHSTSKILQFMGMVNFYREYVHQLSTSAEPLFRLLKKEYQTGGPLPFGDEQRTAMRHIKEELKRDILRSHPDFRDPNAEFVIMTDASKVAAGAALFQWQKDAAVDNGSNTDRHITPSSLREEKDPFLKAHHARIKEGYQLKCIAFLSLIATTMDAASLS